MLPIKTPVSFLTEPSRTVVKGCLNGLRKLPLQQLGDRVADMPDETKALVLLHELDHLIWLRSIWPRMDTYVEGTDVERPDGQWVPLTADVAKWCLLDRYRSIAMDAQVREWLEQ